MPGGGIFCSQMSRFLLSCDNGCRGEHYAPNCMQQNDYYRCHGVGRISSWEMFGFEHQYVSFMSLPPA